MPKWNRKAPFINGRLLNYVDPYVRSVAERRGEIIEWRDADNPFDGDLDLKFVGFGRGRSAAYGIFEDEYGRSYTMFLKDLEVIMIDGRFKTDLTGEFVVKKRGTNFGIALKEK